MKLENEKQCFFAFESEMAKLKELANLADERQHWVEGMKRRFDEEKVEVKEQL